MSRAPSQEEIQGRMASVPHISEDREANMLQRQTVVGHFFELDRLVVEGGISVC